MRLHRTPPPGPRIPVIPFANLALLVASFAIVAWMYAASRGPGLRFASVDRDGGPGEAGAVRVEVSSERETSIDGSIVPFEGLADALAARLAGRAHPAVILVVSPEASYETMVAAYGAIAGLPSPPRIVLPAMSSGTRG